MYRILSRYSYNSTFFTGDFYRKHFEDNTHDEISIHFYAARAARFTIIKIVEKTVRLSSFEYVPNFGSRGEFDSIAPSRVKKTRKTKQTKQKG